MKTLIVYNHPYDGSFCHAILENVMDGLKTAGQEIDLIDLDKDGFDPVMHGEDLLGFKNHEIVDPLAKDYGARLQDADHLVFIFPIWWELMPALTKGFIDKVFFPGTAYEYNKNGMTMYSLLPKLQDATVITTMNTPAPLYATKFGNAVSKALISGTLKKGGIKKVKWISFNMVKMSSDEKRAKWLATIKETFSK